MSLLKNIFRKKEKPIKTYDDFWNWFAQNEKAFFNVVKSHNNVEQYFFNRLSPKLNQLREGFSYLTGMFNTDTVELIITADGIIKNVVFTEELIATAPALKGWKFTALKPANGVDNSGIEMAGYKFNINNMFFYSNDLTVYPDEVDITIIHDDLNENNKKAIIGGCDIFLDNYLGELEFLTTIDNVKFAVKNEAEKELIPVTKLEDFLNWRQKEFIEKHTGTRYNIENDSHSILETELDNGRALIAVINMDLLKWGSKASHPWILTVEIKFEAEKNNGMPDKPTQELLIEIEDKLYTQLKDIDGYLNIGRETGNGTREVHFACQDFRTPSKVAQLVCDEYAGRAEIGYDIYKDKYWKSFNRFSQV